MHRGELCIRRANVLNHPYLILSKNTAVRESHESCAVLSGLCYGVCRSGLVFPILVVLVYFKSPCPGSSLARAPPARPQARQANQRADAKPHRDVPANLNDAQCPRRLLHLGWLVDDSVDE